MNYYIAVIDGLEYWFTEDSPIIQYVYDNQFRLIRFDEILNINFDAELGRESWYLGYYKGPK